MRPMTAANGALAVAETLRTCMQHTPCFSLVNKIQYRRLRKPLLQPSAATFRHLLVELGVRALVEKMESTGGQKRPQT